MKRRQVLLACFAVITIVFQLVLNVFDVTILEVKEAVTCAWQSREEQDSSLLHAWLNAGNAALDVGRWKIRAPRLKPEIEDPKAELSRTLKLSCVRQDEDRLLLDEARRIAQTDGKFRRPKLTIAALGTYERYAAMFFQRALMINPENIEAKRGLADAEDALRVAIQAQAVLAWPKLPVQSDSGKWPSSIGSLDHEQLVKKIEEFAADLEAASNGDPAKKRAVSQWLLQDATESMKQHDYEETASSLSLALQLDPTNQDANQAFQALPSIMIETARRYARSGLYDDAERFLREVLFMQPDNPDLEQVRQSIRQQRLAVEEFRRKMEAM